MKSIFAIILSFIFINCHAQTEYKNSNYTIVYEENKGWIAYDKNQKLLYNGPDYASEGLFRMIKNGKIGFADEKSGKIVIKPTFSCAFPFSNGKAQVAYTCESFKEGEYIRLESKQWIFIDKSGKMLSKSK